MEVLCERRDVLPVGCRKFFGYRPWNGMDPAKRKPNPTIVRPLQIVEGVRILSPRQLFGTESEENYQLQPYHDSLYFSISSSNETRNKCKRKDELFTGAAMLQIYEVRNKYTSLPLSFNWCNIRISDITTATSTEKESKELSSKKENSFRSFVIEITREGTNEEEEEGRKKAISWNVNNDKCDQLLVHQVGSFLVKYAVFSRAVRATFDLQLFPRDKNFRASDIHGDVTVTFRLFRQREFIEIPLFHKTRGGGEGEKLVAGYGDSLKLHTSILSVPMDLSLLELQVNICDGGSDFLIQGKVLITPRSVCLTHHRLISSESGDILLRVIWNPCPCAGGLCSCPDGEVLLACLDCLEPEKSCRPSPKKED